MTVSLGCPFGFCDKNNDPHSWQFSKETCFIWRAVRQLWAPVGLETASSVSFYIISPTIWNTWKLLAVRTSMPIAAASDSQGFLSMSKCFETKPLEPERYCASHYPHHTTASAPHEPSFSPFKTWNWPRDVRTLVGSEGIQIKNKVVLGKVELFWATFLTASSRSTQNAWVKLFQLQNGSLYDIET